MTTASSAPTLTPRGAERGVLATQATAMLQALELSPLSKRTYRCGINALFAFLRQTQSIQGDLDPGCIDEDTLQKFGVWLRDRYPDLRARARGEARATRTGRTYLVAAKRLFNWLDLHALLPAGVSYDRMLRRIDSGRGSRRTGYQQRRTDPDVARVITHFLRQPLPPAPGATPIGAAAQPGADVPAL